MPSPDTFLVLSDETFLARPSPDNFRGLNGGSSPLRSPESLRDRRPFGPEAIAESNVAARGVTLPTSSPDHSGGARELGLGILVSGKVGTGGIDGALLSLTRTELRRGGKRFERTRGVLIGVKAGAGTDESDVSSICRREREGLRGVWVASVGTSVRSAGSARTIEPRCASVGCTRTVSLFVEDCGVRGRGGDGKEESTLSACAHPLFRLAELVGRVDASDESVGSLECDVGGLDGVDDTEPVRFALAIGEGVLRFRGTILLTLVSTDGIMDVSARRGVLITSGASDDIEDCEWRC